MGTADNIPYKRNMFDIIFFNFCLYLCDQTDYDKIYSSADKALKKDGIIIIYDFFYKKIKKIIYKHDKRLFSTKQDFRKIFLKHKKYDCIHHDTFKYSKNNILGITKFNLLSLNWHSGIIALGGICKNNINKLKCASSIGCGFKSLINEV